MACGARFAAGTDTTIDRLATVVDHRAATARRSWPVTRADTVCAGACPCDCLCPCRGCGDDGPFGDGVAQQPHPPSRATRRELQPAEAQQADEAARGACRRKRASWRVGRIDPLPRRHLPRWATNRAAKAGCHSAREMSRIVQQVKENYTFNESQVITTYSTR
jgi:hypothetical protein